MVPGNPFPSSPLVTPQPSSTHFRRQAGDSQGGSRLHAAPTLAHCHVADKASLLTECVHTRQVGLAMGFDGWRGPGWWGSGWWWPGWPGWRQWRRRGPGLGLGGGGGCSLGWGLGGCWAPSVARGRRRRQLRGQGWQGAGVKAARFVHGTRAIRAIGCYCYSHKARFSPSCAPAVLHLPVAAGEVVADNHQGMVGGLAGAARGVVDAPAVGVEV